ncbi:MAG: hypothetical protein AAGA44_17075 [Pseudomonadota bacterium]
MIKTLLRACLIAFTFILTVPASATVTTVDRVRVLDGRIAETLYYYQHNWMAYRAAAKRAGVIESYELLVDRAASGGETLLLVTVYRDRAQYAAREDNFAPIMDRASPAGPRLLNALSPAEFRTVDDLGTFETVPPPAQP